MVILQCVHLYDLSTENPQCLWSQPTFAFIWFNPHPLGQAKSCERTSSLTAQLLNLAVLSHCSFNRNIFCNLTFNNKINRKKEHGTVQIKTFERRINFRSSSEVFCENCDMIYDFLQRNRSIDRRLYSCELVSSTNHQASRLWNQIKGCLAQPGAQRPLSMYTKVVWHSDR